MGELYIEKWENYFEATKTEVPISLIFCRKDNCEIFAIKNL